MSGKRALVGILVIIVALAIVSGIMIIGPPNEERRRRMDSRRVNDLQRISGSLAIYYVRQHQVPASLEELAKEPGLANVPRDPVTDRAYGYRMLNTTSYQLCSAFDRESADSRAEDFWAHGAGQQCFTLDVMGKTP